MRSYLLSILIAFTACSVACGGSSTKKDEQPTEQTEEEYTDAMGEQHGDDSPKPSPQAEKAPEVEVETTKVEYATIDGRTISGLLSKPKGAGKNLPGIIVIHEWWGLNSNIKSMSEQLAARGYVTLAVDLYGGRVAEEPDRAKELMTEAMASPDDAKANLRSAYATLKKQGAGRVGVIGWCFGGAWSLQTALMFPEKIDATAIYYGRLVLEKEKLATLDMPILGIFGAEDSSIPVKNVRQFEKTLKELDKDVDIRIYDNAGHAFANPSGENYVEEAAEDAWQRTLDFFAEHLKGEGGAEENDASTDDTAVR